MRKFTILILILVLNFLSSTSFAEEKMCYEVKLQDEIITCITQGVGSISASERAKTIESRLKGVADDYSITASDIQVTENDKIAFVLAKDNPIISVTEKDVDKSKYSSSYNQAFSIAEKVQNAITVYREDYSSHSILMGVVYTILASVGLAIALFLIKKISVLLTQGIYSLSGRFLSNLKIKSYQIINVERANKILYAMIAILRTGAMLFILYLYVSLILSFFPWTAKLSPKILGYIIDPLKVVVTLIINYIPNIFFIAVIIFITHYILKMIKVIFNEIELGNISFSGFHKEWAQPTFKLVRVIIGALALVMIFPYLPGSSSPAFQGLSVFLGVLISFSSGSAIANIIAGIVLTYMRPFKLGDRVKIADTVGDIVERNFLVTRVKTIKNTDITIPNSMVLGSHIINYSSSASEQGLILNTTVTIGYDVPWTLVHNLLKQAGLRTDLIDQKKPPFVFQAALNDFHVSYELNVYTQYANDMAKIYSELHKNIQDVFNESGVEIMSPGYHAIRDGNEITVPKSYRKDDYITPSFRVKS